MAGGQTGEKGEADRGRGRQRGRKGKGENSKGIEKEGRKYREGEREKRRKAHK